LLPLSVIGDLARAKRDAQGAELRGTAGLLCSGVHVGARSDLEVDEAGGDYRECYLSLQESAGNSTGPERDVVLGVLRHRSLNEDVADLQASARFEHPCHLL
jgi:hypothetical protein